MAKVRILKSEYNNGGQVFTVQQQVGPDIWENVYAFNNEIDATIKAKELWEMQIKQEYVVWTK